MKILYLFPHPDDESFGPAAIMHKQIKELHEVYLLTLTKGGATKQRFKLGKSIKEMGEIRHKEMLEVEKVLGLKEMRVLDLPDNGMKDMDPREIERIVELIIKEIKPNILVTYPVHGISGFHDHIVIHAAVKRVFLQLRDQGADYLKRLAFFTLPDPGGPVFLDNGFRIKNSSDEDIDCVIDLYEEDIEVLKKCLECYSTYKETIEESRVVERIGDKLYLEFYNESFDPPVNDLTF